LNYGLKLLRKDTEKKFLSQIEKECQSFKLNLYKECKELAKKTNWTKIKTLYTDFIQITEDAETYYQLSIVNIELKEIKGDLGVATGSRHEDQTGAAEPDLFLYDTFPGGIGQSEPLFKMRRDLLAKARELLMACPCEEGCPSCVGPPGEVGVGAKEVASRLVAELLVAPEKAVAAGE
jgi:ATP-dependent helicase YprA (DUF1998 family)